MKPATAGMASHLEGATTTLCSLWKVTRTDGAVFAYTDHDRDLTISGQTYVSRYGYIRTAITSRSDMSVDNLDVLGLLAQDEVTSYALRNGVFDYAEIEIHIANWSNPADGTILLRRGRIGEVVVKQDGAFSAELRGLTQALSQIFGQKYSPICRTDLGSSKCKVDVEALALSGTVTAVASRKTFTGTHGAIAAGYFDFGVIKFTSGENIGRQMEVKTAGVDDGSVEMFLPLNYPIGVGDGYTIYPGCDRRMETCRDRFNNIINFRGEPFVPGPDAYRQVN